MHSTRSFLTEVATIVDASTLAQQQGHTDARAETYLIKHIEAYQQRLHHLSSQLDTHARSTYSNRFDTRQDDEPNSYVEIQREWESIHAQHSTWLLLHHLRRTEDSRPPTSHPDPSFSHATRVNRIISDDVELQRAHAVLRWAEQVAANGMQIAEHGEVSFRRTLRSLPRSTPLDPDAELRTGMSIIDHDDHDEEMTLLTNVWKLIRAGQIERAQTLCREYKQWWRAASMSGGKLWHDQMQSDQPEAVSGNRQRLLWKAMCTKLAESPRISPVEQAIYGSLGGSLARVLPSCVTWEDTLWALVKKMCDDRIDATLVRELSMDTTSTFPSSSWSLSTCFTQLESDAIISTTIRSTINDPYHRLQKLLILGDYDRIDSELSSHIQQAYPHLMDPRIPLPSHLSHSYLIFAIHLYLYFHPECPIQQPTNTHGTLLITSYIRYLITHHFHPLVTAYVSYLPSSQRISEMASFLTTINDGEQRRLYLQQAKQYFPQDVLAITKQLVTDIFTQESQQHLDSGVGQMEVSVADNEKIRALDCFDYQTKDPQQLQEAISQANRLFRTFILSDRLAAATALSTHLSRVRLDMTSPTLTPILHEFSGWKLYITAFQWYRTWNAHHVTRPRDIIPSTQSSSFNQQHAVGQQTREQQQRLHEWSGIEKQNVSAAIDACHQVLLCEGGWMIPGDESDERTRYQAEEIRHKCIPSLVFMLHTICYESGDYAASLGIGDMVADERHALYTAFQTSELQALLRLLRRSYLRVTYGLEETLVGDATSGKEKRAASNQSADMSDEMDPFFSMRTFPQRGANSEDEGSSGNAWYTWRACVADMSVCFCSCGTLYYGYH